MGNKRGEYHKHDVNGQIKHVDTESSDGKRIIHEIERYCSVCGELVTVANNGSTPK